MGGATGTCACASAGSSSTWRTRTVTDTVCDNTRALALAEHGQEFKVKHSRHSRAQLGPARQALQMVHTLADEFAAEIAALCSTQVSDRQWEQFLDAHVPPPTAPARASPAER